MGHICRIEQNAFNSLEGDGGGADRNLPRVFVEVSAIQIGCLIFVLLSAFPREILPVLFIDPKFADAKSCEVFVWHIQEFGCSFIAHFDPAAFSVCDQ